MGLNHEQYYEKDRLHYAIQKKEIEQLRFGRKRDGYSSEMEELFLLLLSDKSACDSATTATPPLIGS